MALILAIVSVSSSAEVPDQVIISEQGGTIGRSDNNTLVLKEPSISRSHAQLYFQDGSFYLKDTSLAGTVLLNKKLKLSTNEIAVLEQNDQIQIGQFILSVNITEPSPKLQNSVQTPIDHKDFSDQAIVDQGVDIPYFLADISLPITPNKVSVEIENKDHNEFRVDFFDNKQSVDANLPDFLTLANPIEFDLKSHEQPEPFDHQKFPEVLIDQENHNVSKMNKGVEGSVLLPNPGGIEPLSLFTPSPEFSPISSVEKLDDATISQTLASNPILPSVNPVSSNSSSQLLQEFCFGLGMPGFTDSVKNSEKFMFSAGVLLRIMINGLIDVVEAREKIKYFVGVEGTTIREMDNNPIKFFTDVDALIKALLLPENSAFMKSEDAIMQVIRDIILHQVAMMDGIEASLDDIFRHFDPQRIENQVKDGLFKKANCWEEYLKQYPQLLSQAQENFFSDSFKEAYDKRLKSG